MTAPPSVSRQPAATAGQPARGPGFGHLLLAEWTKMRSVRSTVWSLTLLVTLACFPPLHPPSQRFITTLSKPRDQATGLRAHNTRPGSPRSKSLSASAERSSRRLASERQRGIVTPTTRNAEQRKRDPGGGGRRACNSPEPGQRTAAPLPLGLPKRSARR